MATQRIHIVPHDQGWALKREGQNNVESVHSTQKDAIDAGRDMARQDEVDLVVHRQDGTFRNVLTYTNEPMSDNGNKRMEAQDILSVGSRVSWGAVLIGACVALAISAVLSMGGVALGVSVSERMEDRTLSVVGGIWLLVSTLFALFCGGYVVSRLTAGENKTEAVMYGVALWGVLFALAAVLGISGASTMTQLAALQTTADRPLLTDDNIRKLELNPEQRERLEAMVGAVDPRVVAWWGFASLVLSLGAAVLGSIIGSGPTFSLIRFGGARQPTATVQPT